MSYLTKRNLALRPVLDKKKNIEEATVEVKQKQELEQNKLDQIKADLQSAGLELDGINDVLFEISNNSEALGGEVLDYIHKALSAIKESEDTLNNFSNAIKELELVIQSEIEKYEDLKKYQETIYNQISEADARLERKRTDIRIYETRLKKRLKDSGMEDVIKVVFE